MRPAAAQFASIGTPHLGGVYTVYRNLRHGLARHGIEVRWVGAGPHARQVMQDPAWASEHANGEAIEVPESDAATGRAACRHLVERGYEGVFVNVRMRPVEMNLVRYLPRHIRRVMIVHSSQPGTYGPAASLRRFVDATVGVSPRVRDHLVRWRGFDPSTTHCIVNGVHTSQYPPRRGRGSGPLRLLYLGRIEERQKGVFWLPEIMRRLDRHPVALTVAGEGADLPKLRRRCEDLGDRVWFIGAVPAGNVPQLLARHDALILPSRYEGLAMSLIEAMAAGCVPVASSLGGVTDFAVSHESNGFLFPVGNVKAAARCIATLADDEARCARMGEAARKTVQERFDIDVVAAAYARVIDQVRRRKPTCGPLDLDDWSYPMAFNNRLRRVVPEPVRRWVLSR